MRRRDFVPVFTGGNIPPARPRLSHREAIDRVLQAIIDHAGSDR